MIAVVTTHVKRSKNNSTSPSACCRGDTWVTVTVDTAPCLPYTLCMSPFELCVIKKEKKTPPKQPRWHGPVSFQELLNTCVFYKSCVKPEVNNTCCVCLNCHYMFDLFPCLMLGVDKHFKTLDSFLLKLSPAWWIGGKIVYLLITAYLTIWDGELSVCLSSL